MIRYFEFMPSGKSNLLPSTRLSVIFGKVAPIPSFSAIQTAFRLNGRCLASENPRDIDPTIMPRAMSASNRRREAKWWQAGSGNSFMGPRKTRFLHRGVDCAISPAVRGTDRVDGKVMAEKSGSRTHQRRLTPLTGFEVRAPHQDAILFQASSV
jgi:hypothetical protein